MRWIEGIAIDTNVTHETVVFHLLLWSAMALVAQRLQRAIEKCVSIPLVWLDVVCHLSRNYRPMVKAHDT
jgi:hypothetical protein